jgi:hypothetical protein
MSTELKVEYLSTPEGERFEKYGERLLEFQRREALLDPHRAALSAAEVERYRALPDYESSVRFLEERGLR